MSGANNNIRVAAAAYAKRFLANKYKDEYSELYRAYLTNRGIPVSKKREVIDEREIANEQ